MGHGQYKGKINLLDDERECLGMALKKLGFSDNTQSQDELDEATQILIEQKPLVSTYDSVNMKRAMVQGQSFVMCWDGDVLMGIDTMGGDAQAKKLLHYVLPEEGFCVWTDGMGIPEGLQQQVRRPRLHELPDGSEGRRHERELGVVPLRDHPGVVGLHRQVRPHAEPQRRGRSRGASSWTTSASSRPPTPTRGGRSRAPDARRLTEMVSRRGGRRPAAAALPALSFSRFCACEHKGSAGAAWRAMLAPRT